MTTPRSMSQVRRLAVQEATPPPDVVAGLLVVTARCCRDWLVAAYVGIGRCGYCDERPVVVR